MLAHFVVTLDERSGLIRFLMPNGETSDAQRRNKAGRARRASASDVLFVVERPAPQLTGYGRRMYAGLEGPE